MTNSTDDTSDSTRDDGSILTSDTNPLEDATTQFGIPESHKVYRRNSLSNTTDHSATSTAKRRAIRRGGNRRGSCTMISKHQLDMDDEELCAKLAGEEVELQKSIQAVTKKSSKKSLSAKSGEKPPLPSSRRPSMTTMSSTAIVAAPKKPKSPTKASSSSEPNEDENEDDPEAALRLKRANEKIQLMFLEQRKKERAARLDAAKKRIQQKKQDEAAAAAASRSKTKKKKSSKAKKRSSVTGGSSTTSTTPTSPSKSSSNHDDDPEEDDIDDDSVGPAPAPAELSEKERRQIAYQWYMRCGMPNKKEFRLRVKRMAGACDISPDDVELLPWIQNGARVNVKQMLLL